MGRTNQHDDLTASTVGRVHLKRARFVDGAYDEGGAYWGCGDPLYCAWSQSGLRYYFRAKSIREAKSVVRNLSFPIA